jgi:ribosomal RNA-processing protein 12
MISLLQNDAFPELLEIVCQSLQAICSNALQRNPTKQQTAEFAAIAEQAKHFLPILFNLVEVMDTSDPRYQSVSDAIAHYSKCTPENLLSKMFKKLVQRLLAATTAENLHQADKAAGYLNLAAAIAPSLSMECVELLFRAIKPLISLDDVSLVQKRAYKVLVALLDTRATDLLQGPRKAEILELLTTALLTCHVSARTMRMRCLQGVFRNGVEADEAYEIAVSIAGEVILSLKDSNSKAREAAKELYLAMARIIGFDHFFQLVPAGLAASTTHMRSGTVLALTLLLKEFASEKVRSCLRNFCIKNTT